MIKVLKTAGNSVRDDIVSSLIGIISSNPDLHGYTSHQFYKIIQNDMTQQPLVQVASWTLGEFGDLFVHGQYEKPEDGENFQVKFIEYLTTFTEIDNISVGDRRSNYRYIRKNLKLVNKYSYNT